MGRGVTCHAPRSPEPLECTRWLLSVALTPTPTCGFPPAHACEVKRLLWLLTCVIWQPLAHILKQGPWWGGFQIPQWQRSDATGRGEERLLR